MKLSKEIISLMGQKVEYCRAAPGEDGKPVLTRGNGIVVGVIIGASRRIQIMVKDESANKDAAWTLDLRCVNPTDDEAAQYWDHHQNIHTIVAEHNQAQRDREQEKIKEIDEINYVFFGQPLDV